MGNEATQQGIGNSITVGEVTGSFVLVRLTSIEHAAGRSEPVDNEFEVEVTITDGGLNKKGKFGPQQIKLGKGSKLTPNEVIFMGDYDTSDPGNLNIQFDFDVETDMLSGGFVGETTGSNQLDFGVQMFYVPVELQSASGASTLIFRGRVDVSR